MGWVAAAHHAGHENPATSRVAGWSCLRVGYASSFSSADCIWQS
jgi:hypothetical protein